MNDIFRDVRKGDAALALLLTALGALLMVANITGAEDGTRIDSRSWAMVPVFALATLPILWRRRAMLPVLGITLAALAVHVVAFDWVVRCGAGLPLAFALAYGVGRLLRGRDSYLGLGLTLGVQVLVLVRDSAAGLDIAPVTGLAGLAAWGVGTYLQHRSGKAELASYDDRVPTSV